MLLQFRPLQIEKRKMMLSEIKLAFFSFKDSVQVKYL